MRNTVNTSLKLKLRIQDWRRTPLRSVRTELLAARSTDFAQRAEFFDDARRLLRPRDFARPDAGRDDDRIVAARLQVVPDKKHLFRFHPDMLREPAHAVGLIYTLASDIYRRPSGNTDIKSREPLLEKAAEFRPLLAGRVPRRLCLRRRVDAYRGEGNLIFPREYPLAPLGCAFQYPCFLQSIVQYADYIRILFSSEHMIIDALPRSGRIRVAARGRIGEEIQVREISIFGKRGEDVFLDTLEGRPAHDGDGYVREKRLKMFRGSRFERLETFRKGIIEIKEDGSRALWDGGMAPPPFLEERNRAYD